MLGAPRLRGRISELGIDGKIIRDHILTGVQQADSLTEEQVSEFKEAFSLFVSSLVLFLNPFARCAPTIQRRHHRVRLTFVANEQDKDGDGRFSHTKLCITLWPPSISLSRNICRSTEVLRDSAMHPSSLPERCEQDAKC